MGCGTFGQILIRNDASSSNMMRANIRLMAGKDSKMLCRVLSSESHEDIPRGNIKVQEADGEVAIDITAQDAVTLRAVLNSYLRWAKLAIDAKDAIEVFE